MELVNLYAAPQSPLAAAEGPNTREETLGEAIVELAILAIDAGHWEPARDHVYTALQALETAPPTPPIRQADARWAEPVNAAPIIGDPLTTAELRLVPYLPTHLTIQEIANRMYLSRNTISSQIGAIYRKLGARSRHEAVQRAIETGLLGDQTLKRVV